MPETGSLVVGRSDRAVFQVTVCGRVGESISPRRSFFFFLVRRYPVDSASPRGRKSLGGRRFAGGDGAIWSEFRVGGATKPSAGEAKLARRSLLPEGTVGKTPRPNASQGPARQAGPTYRCFASTGMCCWAQGCIASMRSARRCPLVNFQRAVAVFCRIERSRNAAPFQQLFLAGPLRSGA